MPPARKSQIEVSTGELQGDERLPGGGEESFTHVRERGHLCFRERGSEPARVRSPRGAAAVRLEKPSSSSSSWPSVMRPPPKTRHARRSRVSTGAGKTSWTREVRQIEAAVARAREMTGGEFQFRQMESYRSNILLFRPNNVAFSCCTFGLSYFVCLHLRQAISLINFESQHYPL